MARVSENQSPANNAPANQAPANGRQLWTANYALTLLGTFSFFGSFFYLLSVLPNYVDSIGGEEWHVGLIVGGFNIVPLFLRPFAGRWSDAGHRLIMMRVSLVIFAGSLALMVLSEDIWSLLALRVVQGIGMAMFPTAAGSMVAEIIPLPRRGEGVGFFGMATSLSQMAFPAIGVIVADTWGFDAIFIVAATTSAVTLLMVLPIREPAPHPGRPRGELLPRRALFPMLVFLTMTFSFGAASAFLPLLSDERDLGNVGLYFLVGGAAAVVTRPMSGALSDRIGRISVVLPGLLVSALGMWVLTQATGLPMLLVSVALGGVGLGTVHTGLLALSLDRVAETQRGGATAVFQIAWDVGGLLGGTVLGFVASAIDVEAVFWIASVFLLSGMVMLLGGRARGWTSVRKPRPLLVGARMRPQRGGGA